VGTKLALSDNIALYLEGGYNSNDFADKSGNKYGFIKSALGLEFAFGKTKDSDGDGVSDRKDKCPDTPAGVKVDLNGCPLDRDGDGVPDYKDDCPNTPGLAAFNGCPDKDGDGIMDKEDDCPDVPGLKKFNGCPDTDGDGVPDPKDECPNTPKGCKVDMKGCPLDTDKDGIIDCEDQCPDVAGVKELKGCPIICKAFDVSPVYFDFDKATLRPEGMAALDAFINQLGDCKQYDIVVDGFTCSIGTKKYNQGLSEERALEVVKYLTSKGINNAFIGSKGYGEENPALPNTNKTNREKNRRAVIELTVK
jgi:outer membrane protein OmpA-like peptidoglycan-associated protein